MNIGLCVYPSDSRAAVELYLRAFQAELGYHVKNEDGSFFHAEIVHDGQTIVAVSESDKWANGGMCMQFCLNIGDEALLRNAYAVLSEGGKVMYELAPCDWNALMADLVDRFGVRWYIAM